MNSDQCYMWVVPVWLLFHLSPVEALLFCGGHCTTRIVLPLK